MRIIGGKHKGKRFTLPKGSKTRPTTDFAKEALFNFLQSDIELEGIRAIDLFAGTGAIGFELVSRGAGFVYWVEIDGRSCIEINKLIKELKCDNAKLIKADAHKIIDIWVAEPLDLVFLDAPFTFKSYFACAKKIANSKMCHPDTTIVIEHLSSISPFENVADCTFKKYGQIMFSIFKASALINE